MTRKYNLIPIGDGYVALAREFIYKGDYYFMSEAGCIKAKFDLGICDEGKTNKVIAHTGLKELEGSGLPLIVIQHPKQKEATTKATKAWMDIPPEVKVNAEGVDYCTGFVEGFLSAGGYSEGDLRNAMSYIWQQIVHKKVDMNSFGSVSESGELYIQSLKKHPTAIVVEMQEKYIDQNLGEDDDTFMEMCKITPKIVDNHLIIKEVKYE